MKSIKIGNKEITVEKPKSLALLFEFAIAWSTSEDAISNARLCAAAIGIYIDKHAILPKYRRAKDSPLSYGYKCLERLLELKVAGSDVYDVGTELLSDMARSLPRTEVIEEKQDFFPSENMEDGSI